MTEISTPLFSFIRNMVVDRGGVDLSSGSKLTLGPKERLVHHLHLFLFYIMPEIWLIETEKRWFTRYQRRSHYVSTSSTKEKIEEELQ